MKNGKICQKVTNVDLNTKVRLLQTFNHIVTIPAVVYALYTGSYYLFTIAFVAWLIVGPISSVITLHRLLTHRSFKTHPWLEKVLSYISVVSTVGPTISWVALHRQHHAQSDKASDPHSPYIDGKFSLVQSIKVWLGYDWHIPNIPVAYVKDLMRSPTHKFIFNNYFKIIFAYSLILMAIDPLLWLFVYVVPASMTVHLIGVVNVFGHMHGYRTYDTTDKSTNSWIANLVSLGDGWHNNHHGRPGKWYAGEKWWEWDLMGRIIQLIKID
jgi:stearoyl-CoA desaturase (delta-9 desaturase)